MRRFWLLAAAVTAALFVPAAHAARPTFVPLPPVTVTDTTCGFDVSVQLSAGETLKVFSSGTVIVSGPLTATFSANGKTVTATIPGPVIAISGHAVFGYGLYGGPLQLPDGRVILAYASGKVDVSDFPTLVHGTVLADVCAALAP